MKLDTKLYQSAESIAKSDGYDTDFILYHGSDYKFSSLGPENNRNADLIFTAKDPFTATIYGKFVYKIAPKIKHLADLTDDYKLLNLISDEFYEEFLEDYKFDNLNDLQDSLDMSSSHNVKSLINNLIKYVTDKSLKDNDYDAIFDDKYDVEFNKIITLLAKQKVFDFIQSGESFNRGNGSIRNNILHFVFDNGYDSIKLIDLSHNGESLSYIFRDPTLLFILARDQ